MDSKRVDVLVITITQFVTNRWKYSELPQNNAFWIVDGIMGKNEA